MRRRLPDLPAGTRVVWRQRVPGFVVTLDVVGVVRRVRGRWVEVEVERAAPNTVRQPLPPSVVVAPREEVFPRGPGPDQ